MKEVLSSYPYHTDGSSYFVDKVKHESGFVYLELVQKIVANDSTHRIKIKPKDASAIIDALIAVCDDLPKSDFKKSDFVSSIDLKKIEKRYLSGVELEDLEVQFGLKKEELENILVGRGIVLASNKIPKAKYWRRRYRK